MNILVTILLVIAALIALLLILGLFTKKECNIIREISIHKSKQRVFDYIKLLKNQDYYNKWVMTDPNMKKEFRGTDGTAGFVYAWNGNKQAGEGEQEITKVVEGELVDSEVRFVRPFKSVAHATFTTSAISNDQTLVKWHITTGMGYPMNVMLLFMNMDKMMGKDMEISLGNLKKLLEGNG
ncbi:MAG: SRPBCC family protein [Chitinophagaceae bacterium]